MAKRPEQRSPSPAPASPPPQVKSSAPSTTPAPPPKVVEQKIDSPKVKPAVSKEEEDNLKKQLADLEDMFKF